MEPRYVVRSTFDRKAAGVVARVMGRRLTTAWRAATAFVWAVSAAFLLGLRDTNPFWPIASVAMGLFALALPGILAREIYRNYNKKVGEAIFSFGDEGMEVRCAIEETTLRYPGLVRLVESREYFLLFPQRQAAYLLPKAGFCAGDAQGFPSFLEEASGLRFEHVRF